jgi:resuscitation-promoting factor RpfA
MTDREPSLLGGSPEASPADASPGPAVPRADADAAETEKSPAEPPPRPPPEPRPAGRRDAPTVHVAGFWRRFAAGWIDVAVFLPIGLLLAWVATTIAGLHLPPSRIRGVDFWLDLILASDPALVTSFAMIVAAAVIYLLVFQILLGQTLGMRVLRIRVIDVWGDRPSIARCAARTGGYLVGAATAMLGFLWVGFDSEKRGLHDWIAGTYVIKA